jgi:RHS repeat-associated protein
MAWQHTNVYSAGTLLATYDSNGLHFYLNDPLGTRRAQTDYAGVLEQTCSSLPFGDGLSCTNSTEYPTEHHFTGKERDAESGLDYFGARYYGSSMGRFTSPDPIIMNDLRLINPQRWNKYAYTINNPLTLTDPTGKDAAYVSFSGMAMGYGHSGILSIHKGSGDATYSRFGPMSAGSPAGAGEVRTDYELPTVKFGADAALTQAVADYEGVDSNTVGIDYFQTTDSETSNLDEYIRQRQEASDAGKSPNYCVIGSSCRDYALGGLVAGGAIESWRTQFFSAAPNDVLHQLSGLADQYLPDATKATVTTSQCDTLPDGGQRCQ